MLGGGKITLDLRYRYEYVDQDDIPTITKTANSSTARLRLGYLSPEFYGFKGFAEYEGNQDILVNNYNSTRNGKTQYPVVADPQVNEINRLWLGFTGIPDTALKAGRQRIIYDNHRFIGNVGWRQLEQTFDSGTIINTSLPDTTVKAAYILRVRDIFSKNVAMNSVLGNIAYDGFVFGNLTAYTYLLDYSDRRDSALGPGRAPFTKSSQTYGVRSDGSALVTADLKVLYTAVYAYQADYERNPLNYDVDYWHCLGGLTAFDVTGKVGIEILGSQNGIGFSTPLATLHVFQGWADKFLVTPPDGIRDMYGSLGFMIRGVKLRAVYHQFDDDAGNIDYDHDIDAVIQKKFGKHYTVLLKYAYYDADDFATDTEKIWLQFSVSF